MERERVFYFDRFYVESANFLWKKAFEAFAEVATYDYLYENPQNLWPKICAHQPTHIHLGGSAKADSFPIELIASARRKFRCSVSHFYEDALFSSFHFRTAQVVDRVYLSNKTYIECSRKRGLENFDYWPASPADPEVYYPRDVPKIYDVIFIGNNNDPSRFATLKRLAEKFPVTVFGRFWEGTGLNAKEAVFHEEYAQAVSSAKVVLSIVGDRWLKLKSYFSNRLINCLSCGAAIVQTYTPGVEEVFEPGKHLMYYHDEADLFERIELLLQDDALRERLAHNARQTILERFTSEKAVERFLADGRAARQRFPKSADPAPMGSIYLSENGFSFSNPPAEIVARPRWGWRWRDHFGFFPSGTNHLVLESEAIPADIFDRLDVWRECRRLVGENRNLVIRNPQNASIPIAAELRYFGFLPAEPAGDNQITLRRSVVGKSALDSWFEQLQFSIQPRFGYRRQDPFALEWCMNHPLTKKLREKNWLQGKILLVWAGLGEWAFALRMDSECEIVGVEVSWIALDYAVDTYGGETLRFLPPLPFLFPDAVFDKIIFLTFPGRMQSLQPFLKEWKRIAKPEARAFFGIYPLDAELPAALHNGQWLLQTFGKECIQEAQPLASNFYAFLAVHPSKI